MNKTLKVMTSAALLAGVITPVAATTASANSDNLVDKVLYVDNDYESGAAAANFLQIKEDDVQFDGSSDTFRLSMPSGAKWLEDKYTSGDTVYITDTGAFQYGGAAPQGFEVVQATESDLELKIVGNWAGGTKEAKIPLFFEVDGGEGELKVTVDPKGSTLTGGQYPFAVVGDGNTTASISKVETIGDGGTIGTIRIDETSIGALYDDQYDTNVGNQNQEIKLRLPSDFEWNSAVAPTLGGGFVGNVNITSSTLANDGRDLVVKFKFTGEPTKVGTFYIAGLQVDADSDADFSDVEVDISGDEVTSSSLKVAKYMEYGTNVKFEDDVPTLIAGRNNADVDDLELAEITLKEEVPNSWLTGRSVSVELPSWVKVVGADITGVKNFNNNGTVDDTILAEIEGDDNKIEFDMPAASSTTVKRELKVKFYVSVEADKEGDITAKIAGRAGVEGDLVLGKAVKPVNVEIKKAEVRTGIKGQEVGDIIIAENAKEAFIKDGQVKVWLPASIEFTSTPKVEVIEGNVEIDEDSVQKAGNVLTFNIDSESTKPSKIKISGVKLDLDRTVAEGDFNIKVGGTALIQNDEAGATEAFGSNDFSIGGKNYYDTTAEVALDADSSIILTNDIAIGEFDKDYIANLAFGAVVTPAEGNVAATEVKFTIGGTSYKVGDTEKAMDVAPFVEGGRTFMPIRYVAEAVGADFINWDQSTQTATILKGDRVVELKAGSTSLKVNGATISMDAAAKVKDGRTVLPVRFVGQALGAQVNYNEADQSVTVK